MDEQKGEEAIYNFLNRMAAMDKMIDDFYAMFELGQPVDDITFYTAARDLGRAGASVYNASKKMAGGSPFSLDDVIRGLKARRERMAGKPDAAP